MLQANLIEIDQLYNNINNNTNNISCSNIKPKTRLSQVQFNKNKEVSSILKEDVSEDLLLKKGFLKMLCSNFRFFDCLSNNSKNVLLKKIKITKSHFKHEEKVVIKEAKDAIDGIYCLKYGRFFKKSFNYCGKTNISNLSNNNINNNVNSNNILSGSTTAINSSSGNYNSTVNNVNKHSKNLNSINNVNNNNINSSFKVGSLNNITNINNTNNNTNNTSNPVIFEYPNNSIIGVVDVLNVKYTDEEDFHENTQTQTNNSKLISSNHHIDKTIENSPISYVSSISKRIVNNPNNTNNTNNINSNNNLNMINNIKKNSQSFSNNNNGRNSFKNAIKEQQCSLIKIDLDSEIFCYPLKDTYDTSLNNFNLNNNINIGTNLLIYIKLSQISIMSVLSEKMFCFFKEYLNNNLNKIATEYMSKIGMNNNNNINSNNISSFNSNNINYNISEFSSFNNNNNNSNNNKPKEKGRERNNNNINTITNNNDIKTVCDFKINQKLDNVLSQIKLIAELGKGGFGVVLLVSYHNSLFAMKIITHNYLLSKARLRAYFKQEIQHTMEVVSPFKADIKSIFFNEFSVNYLMSYDSSLTLRTLLYETLNDLELLPLMRVKEIIINLLIVLDSLHSKDIIHRDVKPENIIIKQDGFIQLIDFGLSVKVKYFTNSIVGSPYYMSPEQIKGASYGKSCDFWSVGVILFEMLFGYNPFKTDSDYSAVDVYSRIIKNEEVVIPLTRIYNNSSDKVNTNNNANTNNYGHNGNKKTTNPTRSASNLKINNYNTSSFKNKEDNDFKLLRNLCKKLLLKDINIRVTDIIDIEKQFSNFNWSNYKDMVYTIKQSNIEMNNINNSNHISSNRSISNNFNNNNNNGSSPNFLHLPIKYFKESDVRKYLTYINKPSSFKYSNINNLNNINTNNNNEDYFNNCYLKENDFLLSLEGIPYDEKKIFNYIQHQTREIVNKLDDFTDSTISPYYNWLNELPLTYKE